MRNQQISLKEVKTIENKILLFRGREVMLDKDLAELYGVKPIALRQQVKRNIKRFPEDFMFQLTQDEKEKVVTNCDRFRNLKHAQYPPYAFTEHGIIMLASVLNSTIAVNVSVQIVRIFIRLRQMLLDNEILSNRLKEIEEKYEYQFKIVFDSINKLISLTDSNSKKPIGFKYGEDEG